MIFSAKVCPRAINFAIAESIHQLLVLRPHPSGYDCDKLLMIILITLKMCRKVKLRSYIFKDDFSEEMVIKLMMVMLLMMTVTKLHFSR